MRDDNRNYLECRAIHFNEDLNLTYKHINLFLVLFRVTRPCNLFYFIFFFK